VNIARSGKSPNYVSRDESPARQPAESPIEPRNRFTISSDQRHASPITQCMLRQGAGRIRAALDRQLHVNMHFSGDLQAPRRTTPAPIKQPPATGACKQYRLFDSGLSASPLVLFVDFFPLLAVTSPIFARSFVLVDQWLLCHTGPLCLLLRSGLVSTEVR